MAPFQTKGGVEVSYAPEYHEVFLDMYGKSPVEQVLIGEVMKAKVPIAETTYNNLKAAIPAATEVAGVDGKKKLTIGRLPGWKLSQVAAPLVLHPLTYDDAVKNYDITLHKAVPTGEIKFLFEFDKERIYEVTFVGLVDTDRTAGDFIGVIGDSSIAADIVAPVVSTIVPADSAVSVALAAPVVLTFSKDINSDTINTANILVVNDATGDHVAGSISYDIATKSATFIPSVMFAASTKFVVIVTTNVRGANGIALTVPYVSTFTTTA
jgi:hypothetical protein